MNESIPPPPPGYVPAPLSKREQQRIAANNRPAKPSATDVVVIKERK